MEAIITATSSVTSVMTSVFSVITGNPLLTFFVAVSVLGTGFSVFRKAKKTAR